MHCRGYARALVVFSHEILNSNPYAFLDDAPLEERRARAVEMRRTLPESVLQEVGALDPAAIAEVRAGAWPDVRDADELADALHTLIALPEGFQPPEHPAPAEAWAGFFEVYANPTASPERVYPAMRQLSPGRLRPTVILERRRPRLRARVIFGFRRKRPKPSAPFTPTLNSQNSFRRLTAKRRPRKTRSSPWSRDGWRIWGRALLQSWRSLLCLPVG